MERKQNKKPTAILCSDIHLREDVPVCRTDNYWEAQWRKVDFISDLQKQYNCYVLHGGDLFDHWKPSPNLIRETLLHLPDKFCSIYGQHDLPQHSIDLSYKCGIDAIAAAGRLKILSGTHWGTEPIGISIQSENGRNILVWHHMTYQKSPFPGASGGMAGGILRKYPEYDLILTGDNHQTFVEEYEGRYLVNPGSMMRMDADQIVHYPSVFLYYAEDNTVEQVFIPIEQDVITRAHIERIEQRDARIDAFVSRISQGAESKMSFEDNIEEIKEKNNIRPTIMDIVYKAIG